MGGHRPAQVLRRQYTPGCAAALPGSQTRWFAQRIASAIVDNWHLEADVTTSPMGLPSERSFGALFAAIFAGMALFSMLKGSMTWAWGLGLLALAFAALATVLPHWLAPLNSAWFQLGVLMGRVVSPVVLGVLFFGLITPVGRIGRWLGRDELRLRRSDRPSHWVDREPVGPAPDSYKNQF